MLFVNGVQHPHVGRPEDGHHPVQGQTTATGPATHVAQDDVRASRSPLHGGEIGVGVLQLFPLPSHLLQRLIPNVLGFHQDGL